MTKKKQVGVRFDSNRTRLKTGETQRPNGTYAYRWSTPDGKRHSIYAPTLEKLREQEEQIIVDKHDGIRSDVKSITVNEMFDLWCQLKMVNEKSTKNVWWKCSICGNEYKAVIRARVHGLQCPVCAEQAVLPGYNDLATTDPELVQEWDVELNGGKLPTQISRNSLYSVWWTGSCGHSWKAKAFDRAVEHTGCIYCEKEFQWHLPRLLVLHYASSYGLEVRLKDEETIGVPLDAYIPELKLAFMFSHKGTQKEKNIQMVIEHLCRKRGIQCECIGAKLSKEEICVAIMQGFCKAHTYIKSDNRRDIEAVRIRFAEWRKQKCIK